MAYTRYIETAWLFLWNIYYYSYYVLLARVSHVPVRSSCLSLILKLSIIFSIILSVLLYYFDWMPVVSISVWKNTLWVPITVVDTVCACRCCYWFINFKCCFFGMCIMYYTSKCAYHVHFKGRPLDNQVNKYCQCQSRWRYEKCHLFLTLKIWVRIFSSSVLTCFARKHRPDWVWVGGWWVCNCMSCFVCLFGANSTHNKNVYILRVRDEIFHFQIIETNWFFTVIHAVVNIPHHATPRHIVPCHCQHFQFTRLFQILIKVKI